MRVPLIRSSGAYTVANHKERIDSSVACNVYSLGRDVLSQQRPLVKLRWSETKCREAINQYTIQLFRKWVVEVTRPQTRFYVRDRNLPIKRC